jgi:DNA-binding transcriptional LysR family regulator
MDQVRAMKIFVRIFERSSFTQAAEDLGMPRATLTHSLNQLEAWLGTRLLERSTRRVKPTLDGEAYYRRCIHLLAELEEAEHAFRGCAPKGTLRLNLHGTLAKFFIIPALPEFLARYPDIQLTLTEADRLVDLVQEGVDCVVRAGVLSDSSLIGKRIATLEQVTCASPGYLDQYGNPEGLEDLTRHAAVNYLSAATGQFWPLEFMVAGQLKEVSLQGRVSVSGAEIYMASAIAGMGIIQVPRYRVTQQLEEGVLQVILPQYPPPSMPVSVLYPHNRHMSARVRVFVDWVGECFAAANSP